MANAEHGVFIEICQQHLEEAAFLYGQKHALSTDPDIPWTALDDWEQRIEAHIDGLVVGGPPALALCEQQAETGDPGELFAALCVGCRHEHSDLVDKIILDLDFTDTERVAAATAALKYALPAQWVNLWRQQLPTSPPELAALKAEVLSYRHIPAQAELLQALPNTPAPFLPAIIRALGRLNPTAPGKHCTPICTIKIRLSTPLPCTPCCDLANGRRCTMRPVTPITRSCWVYAATKAALRCY